MSKWEKWIKEYGKQNRRNVLKLFMDSTQGLQRFEKARERAQNALRNGKRFYLNNDEKLDLIEACKNRSMDLNRALALAWCCNCKVDCFSYYAYGKELILTFDGYYATKGCFYLFMMTNCEIAEGMLGNTSLQEYLVANKRYREDELWRLR